MHLPRRSRVLLGCAVLLALIAASCGDDGTAEPPSTSSTTTTTVESTTSTTTSTTTTTTEPPPPTVPVPVHIDENGFNDHTVPAVDTVEEWFALAHSTADRSVTKFTISDFGRADAAARWADSNFFELHDEWYYFRLLNGQPVPGVTDRPVTGLSFATVAAIYAWAESQGSLPLGLDWIESQTFGRDRLYSRRFYDIILRTTPRIYGAGTLVHLPDSRDGERWLIELEFSDQVTPGDIETYVATLAATLPAEIGDNLEWVMRSPHQIDVGEQMKADGHPLADRIVRWSEIVEPGEIAVYNPGIAAGQLLLVDESGSQLARATDTDIIIMEHVPDYLPPGSALITSSPQTPLAHVNLLARNRGIPNLSFSGVTDDPGISSAARVRSYVIVRAEGDSVDITLIDRDDFLDWQARQDTSTIRVPAVDVETMALTVDLTALAGAITSDAQLDDWRPTIGGKSAGFVALLRTAELTTPPTPLAITVRPYLEHLDLVDDALDAILRNDEFEDDPRARYLFLEGPTDYEAFYSAPRDLEYGAELQAAHPPGTILGDVLAADGFKQYFRAQPMNGATLAALTAALTDRFGHYDDTQGLRFRSSSSVEDIEGFNGAGLYNSNTGFLDPGAQPDSSDHKRSMEYAIKKTWASYWGFEAFEERRRENVDHRSGAMGVTVHARFDDALEENNGVATFTFAPEGSAIIGTAVINVQDGAVSVANPDPTSTDLPEVIEADLRADGSVVVRRIQGSTITSGPILSDAEAETLTEQLHAATTTWRDQVNAGLAAAQAVTVVTLDFEFKTMGAGWPAGAANDDGGLIVKQARSLDPGLRGIPSSVVALDIPRDILARASRVARLNCVGSTAIAAWTDPLLAPDMGFSEMPYTTPTGVDPADCTQSTLYSTPDAFLVELLNSGDRIELTG
ncbi:MAG: PEP/pyruvate-binding domain-containing protein [Acidimicrobiales bacterium]|nr:PEP/pyruvate-binding domain-containing protein [Acidimicrobiales bacterium]